MDHAALVVASTAVVHFLAAYGKDVVGGSAKEIGAGATKNALAKGKKTYDLIKAKLHGKPEAVAALVKVEERRDDTTAQTELQKQVMQVMQEEEGFAEQVMALLKEVVATNDNVKFVTTIIGDVEKYVQIETVIGNVIL